MAWSARPAAAHLAGSCLTPDAASRDARGWLGLAQEEARELFSTRAAALFGIALPALESA